MSGNDKQVDAFSPHLLSVEKSPPSPMPTLLLRVLLVFFLIILAWAFIGRLDIVARAEGQLIPQNRVQIVQPLEDSRVSKILVKEGEKVKKGQVLFTMDATLTGAEKRKYDYEVALAKLQLERIQAQLENRTFKVLENENPKQYEQVKAQFDTQTSSYQTQLNEADSVKRRIIQELSASKLMVESLSNTIPLYEETEQAYKKLQDKGYGDKLGVLEKKRERIVAEKDLQEETYRVKSLTAQLEESESKIDRIKAEYRRQLVEEQVQLNARIHQFEEEINKLAYRENLTELTAPADGVVQDVATHTEGAIVPAGTVVLSVVPADEPLKAEVMVENKDIAHIEQGMPVRVKVVSYEFQKYGMLDAKVEYVSPDAVEEENNQLMPSAIKKYRVYLDLSEQFIKRDGRQFELRPGMQVVSEIKLGTRSVIEYLLSPIQQGVMESGMER